MLPYTILLWLDKKAGVEGKKKAEEEEGEGTRRSSLRLLRLLSGGLAVLAGLVTLFVLGLIFRPLGTSCLAGEIHNVLFSPPRWRAAEQRLRIGLVQRDF